MDYHLPLGLIHFEVSKPSYTDFESSGLPKLPPSIVSFARLHSLRRLSHRNLCRYVDVIHRKPERLFVVTEAYRRSLATLSTPVLDAAWLVARFVECFSAVLYLGEQQMVHCCLTPSIIMLDANDSVKIGGYGMYYATNWGRDVEFPIADPVYSAPEVFLLSAVVAKRRSLCAIVDFSSPCPLTVQVDVWSLGLIFFELIYGRAVANPLHQHGDVVTKFASVNPFLTVRTLLEGLRLSKSKDLTFPAFLNVSVHCDPAQVLLVRLDDLCRRCMNFNPLLRPIPSEAIIELCPDFITSTVESHLIGLETCSPITQQGYFRSPLNSYSATVVPSVIDGSDVSHETAKAIEFLSSQTDVTELYYYWQLTGGNLESVWQEAMRLGTETYNVAQLAAHDVQTGSANVSSPHCFGVSRCTNPPILRIPAVLAMMQPLGFMDVPYVVECPGSMHEAQSPRYHPTPIFLPSQRLLERISHVPLEVLYPLLIAFPNRASPAHPHCDFMSTDFQLGFLSSAKSIGQLLYQKTPELDEACSHSIASDPMEDQPNSVKLTDVEYQVRRVCLFKRLLNGLPSTEKCLRREARKDIPPFLRCQTWAALLGVYKDHDFRERYSKALCADAGDATQEQLASRRLDDKAVNQIAVDLPRCHAYDGLLASPIGQTSLRHVLISTLLMPPGSLEYTQGMDSVAAVFVRLFHPDQALAAACLHALFHTKLSGFFSTGGFTTGLKAFFNVLFRLFAFHAPGLAVSLTNLNVPLVGLTTGWIYTMFAHAMPLDRTELLWDTLIVGPLSFLMFFYIAIFLQLDQQVNLQSLGLEKLCTILSNFPDIDLDKCRADALRFALATPISLTVGPGVNIGGREANPNLPDSVTKSGNASCPFYERLVISNAWPEHLEAAASSDPSWMQTAGKASPGSELCNNWVTDNPLVSLLSPDDVLEHILRPDCFVLDVRSREDYLKGCIPGCVHRPPSQLPLWSNDVESENSSAPPFEWEFVDCPSGDRRQSRVIPAFLAGLITESAWTKAVEARQRAEQRRLGNRTRTQSSVVRNTPGLLLVIGGTEFSSNAKPLEVPVAIQLADWLIREDVDRVCVLRGGMPALLSLPSGRDYLICPGP
ncbi:TBC domain-containing protein kinase-like protein [Clonorchis sinensis]|uniref:TBC domain-containing protein kinase-like protein n=1 Tax=Clonorchis sinensis TaxID=79923 RepID=G7YVF3_CLOSI|nr:TBC domain-containing protein kinase-like protein [Clonorchis sinensis]